MNTTARASTIWSREFALATAERAINTFAQAAVSFLIVGGASGILSVAWVPLLSAAGLAALISVLKSVVLGLSTGSPAVGSQEVLATRDEVVVTAEPDDEYEYEVDHLDYTE